MAQQYLALSLFIILLSFFMLLTRLSDYESTKSQDVLESLEMAFAGRASGDTIQPSAREDIMQTYQKGDALDQIKALFSAQIPNIDIQKNRLGTQMYVRLPLAEFETSLNAVVKADLGGEEQTDGGRFLPVLVSLLETEETDSPLRMDLYLEVDGNPAAIQNEDPQKLQPLLSKAAKFTQDLENAGMPPKRISSGIISAQGGADETAPHIEILFQRYQPLDPTKGQKLQDMEEG